MNYRSKSAVKDKANEKDRSLTPIPGIKIDRGASKGKNSSTCGYSYKNNLQVKDTNEKVRKFNRNIGRVNPISGSFKSSNTQYTQRNSTPNNEIIRQKLKRLFEFYCQFGERMNVNYLKSHKFIKFASDAEMIDYRMSKTRLELIFSSESKSKIKNQLTFEIFLNTLIKISEHKFGNSHPGNALQVLLNTNIFPLYDKLFNPQGPATINTTRKDNLLNEILTEKGGSAISGELNNNDVFKASASESQSPFSNTGNTSPIRQVHLNKFLNTQRNQVMQLPETEINRSNIQKQNENAGSNNTFTTRASISTVTFVNSLVNVDEMMRNPEFEELMKSVAGIMYEIYRVYFPWEISLSENEAFVSEKSMKEYFIFLKDYDLCPSLVSKSAAFQIFQNEAYMSDDDVLYAPVLANIEINPLGRTNNRNICGKCFTFTKFLKCICQIGDLGFDKTSIDSIINTEKYSNTNDTSKMNSYEKICFTFERMELSEGFLSLEAKTNKTHTYKTAYIVPRNILDRIKEYLLKKVTEEKESWNCHGNGNGNGNNILLENENINDSERNFKEQVQQSNREKKLRKSVLGGFQNIFEHFSYIMEKYAVPLQAIYKFYCSFGDPFNTTQMKSNKFAKLLKEAGLIKSMNTNSSFINENSNNTIGLKANEVDLIFFKLAGAAGISASVNCNNCYNMSNDISSTNQSNNKTTINNQSQSLLGNSSMMIPSSISPVKRGSITNANTKIDFNLFINAIEIISLSLFPKRDEIEAIDEICTRYILPLWEKMSSKSYCDYSLSQIIKEKQDNKDFVTALAILHKSILPVYRAYANQAGTMVFEAFLKFCVDFNIFPDLVSKTKLNKYFRTTPHPDVILADISENEYIDENIFVDILAQCAFEIPYREPEPNSVDKILFFVEKISQSDGPSIVQKKYGGTRLPNGENLDLLAIFREFYPQYFSLPVMKKLGFFEMLNQFDSRQTESNNDTCSQNQNQYPENY